MRHSLQSWRQRPKVPAATGTDGWTATLLWVCLGLAVLSAVPVFLITRYLVEETERSRFVVAAERAAYRLAHEVDLTLANLRALKGLFMGSVHVSRDEFSLFVQTLRPREAVRSLEWIPRVPRAERPAVEEAARQDGFPDFRFREVAAHGG